MLPIKRVLLAIMMIASLFEMSKAQDLAVKTAQAESTVHMLNWAIRSVKFLGVEFD